MPSSASGNYTPLLTWLRESRTAAVRGAPTTCSPTARPRAAVLIAEATEAHQLAGTAAPMHATLRIDFCRVLVATACAETSPP